MPEQTAYFEILPGDEASSVLLHVPHASTYIPDDVRRGIQLSDQELAAELDAITDADTDVVAEGVARRAGVRPWIFVNRASRLVVDPERFPDEQEEMNSVGMGAVYEKTTQLETLRTPTDEERRQLIARFYEPYSEALAALVRQRLDAVGRVTIVDVHSYPVYALPYELHGDGGRPEVCIGTDEFHTSPELTAAATEAMRIAAPTGDVDLNSPFAGCYVPLEQHGKNPRVQAVMLEMRRDVVHDDAQGLALAAAALVNVIDRW